MDSKPINPPVWEGFSVTEIQSAFTTLTESCGYEPTTKTLKLILGSGQPVIMAEDEEATLIYRIMQKLAEIHTRPLEQATTTAQPEAGSTAGGAGEADAIILSRNLDHVSTQWVQLHQEMSKALELDFEPEEDIERYTGAIDALRSQVAALSRERDAMRAAVKPFADLWTALFDGHRYPINTPLDTVFYAFNNTEITLNDLEQVYLKSIEAQS